jgi:hypothetical protein
MDNGEWRMENGEWSMDNGEWSMGNACLNAGIFHFIRLRIYPGRQG